MKELPMKKYKSIIIILLFISFSQFCEKNQNPLTINETENTINEPASIISLQVGNKYNYYWSIGSFKLQYGDHGEHKNMIISDTIINGKKYFMFDRGTFRFDEGKFVRIEEKKVIHWDDNQDKVLYDFSVSIGDTVYYGSYVLTVDSIDSAEMYYNVPKELTVFSSSIIDSTHSLYYSYCTKFGFRDFTEISGDLISSVSLFGCILDNEIYGNGFP